jgi:hypothetical protein
VDALADLRVLADQATPPSEKARESGRVVAMAVLVAVAVKDGARARSSGSTSVVLSTITSGSTSVVSSLF